MATPIGNRMKEERERLGFTQIELAARLDGKARNGMKVSRWERGVSVPDSPSLAKLDSLGFDVRYLLVGTRTRALTD